MALIRLFLYARGLKLIRTREDQMCKSTVTHAEMREAKTFLADYTILVVVVWEVRSPVPAVTSGYGS